MALAFDHKDFVSTGASPSTSQTLSFTCTGTDLILIVGVSWKSTASTVGATYNGVSLTQIGSGAANGNTQSQLFYLINPATGTNDIVVTMSASTIFFINAVSLSGADQSTGIDSNNSAAGSGRTASVSDTTSNDNCWLIDNVTGGGNFSLTVGDDQTQRENNASASLNSGMSTQGPLSPVGSYSMSWTIGNSEAWAQQVVAVIPAFVAVEDLAITVSDSITLSESINNSLIINTTASDTISLTESANSTLVNNIATSDSVSIVDIPWYYDDGIATRESYSVVVQSATNDLSIAVSDTGHVSDSVVAQLSIGPSVSDAITITESRTQLLSSRIQVFDHISITESKSALLPTLLVNKSDSLAATESIHSELNSQIAVSDAISLSENSQVGIPLLINVSDTATLAESMNRLLTSRIAASDSITLNESINLLIPTLFLATSDSSTISENVNIQIPIAGQLNITVSDLITISESVNLLIPTLFIATSDSGSLSDAVLMSLLIGVLVTPGIQELQGVKVV